MDNLFDTINGKMFSLLTAEDKRGNFDLLTIIYGLSGSEEFGDFIPKEDVVAAMIGFLEDHGDEVIDDGEGMDFSRKSARDKAMLKLRQFRRLGWIDEESVGGYDALISFTAPGKAFMDFFINYASSASKPLEYTGYVYVIYSTLKHFDLAKSTPLLQQVYRLTKDLMNSLSRLSSEIKSFLNQLLENGDLSPQQILETLLRKYQNQVILRVFNNLRMRDNPSRYSSEIIQALRDLSTDHMSEMVANSVVTNDINDLTKERYEEIESGIRDRIAYVISSFETIDRYLDVIDAQNAKYLSSARARLDFLLSSTKDVSGRINDALKCLIDAPEDYDFENLIRLETSGIIDADSLASPRFVKERVVEVETPIPEGNPEEIDQGMADIFGEDPFSKENVNAAALAFLGGEKEKEARDYPTEEERDLIMLMMMQLISGNRDLSYSVDFAETRYEALGHSLEDFTLSRKEKRHGQK